MDKIIFENLPSEATAVSAENLNLMQSNIEKSVVAVSPTQPTTNEKVWIKKGKNLLNYHKILAKAVGIGIAINSDDYVYDTTSDGDNRLWGYENSNWQCILPAGSYTVSLNFATQSTSASSGVAVYKSDGTQIFIDTEINNISQYTRTFTLDNETQIGIMLKVLDGVCAIQLEQGAEATSFEKYINKEINVKNNGVFEKFYSENDILSYIRSKTVTGTPDSNGFLATGIGLNNVIIGISNASQTAFYTPFYGKEENRLTIKCETWQRVAITTEVTITIHYIPLN